MFRNLMLMLIVLGIVFGGIFGWKHYQGKGQASPGGRAPVVVSTQTVREENWKARIPSVGTLVPTRGVVVASEVEGIVRELYFDSGQATGEGDLLVRLDAEVDMAEAAALEAERKLAELTRNRLRRIVSDNLGSRSDLDEAEAHLENMLAQIDAKQAAIQKKSIRSPFSGELGIRQIHPGHYLAPGDAIVELVSLDPIFVEYTLPERHLSEIAVGQEVVVKVAARPGREFSGKIQAISPSIERATRSVRIRALFDNPGGLLRPGMFAEVDTALPEKTGILTLPERAVTYNPFGNAVFVVSEADGQKTARRVQVATGSNSDGRIEILNGLEPGFEVVTDGHNKLRNGQPITIDNSELPDGSSGSP
jgi:membrane fusion protein (multidrug efflux system)